MPQLDFTIAFPQIFWLIVIFVSIYTILVHFFLPNFIKLIKIRKKLILVNDVEFYNLKTKFTKRQNLTKKIIQRNFNAIKFMLEQEFYSFLKTPSKLNLVLLNEKLSYILYYNTLYYDKVILSLVPLKPNFLSLKIKKNK